MLEAKGAAVEQETADGVLQKVGTLAVLYYPELQVDDPQFTLERDVAWCVEGVDGLVADDLALLKEAIGRTIINPTAYREPLTALIFGHVKE